MLFDDFQTEAQIIKRIIVERRWSQQEPLKCIVLMKSENDKRVSKKGEVLDYLENDQMFIVEVNE